MTTFDPRFVGRNAKPYLHGPEYAAVAEALRIGQWGHNTETDAFEAELAAFLGVPDVVAVSSCTAALHLALLLTGVGPGHEVIVPSQTFCATIQAILMSGAEPHFIDIDADTLCVDSATISGAINPRTRAVLPVFYGGRAVDLTAIQDNLDRREIAVIEDAAHAFGSRLGPVRVGATGALTCFSFGPIKSLTCGEGGALIPRNTDEADRARTLRLLGVSQSQAARIRTTSYDVDTAGWRYHLSAVHAAIGRVQLAHFDTIEIARRNLWRAYARELARLDRVTLVDIDVERTVPFNCVVRVLTGRDRVFEILRDRGIGVGVHYPPNHLQPAFARWSRPLPVTETTARQIMSLPFHPAMTEQDVTHVVSMLALALAESAPGQHL
ncbi:DegT/DnrJ/EryC1/StrS family aminotransferase [Nocardia vinacea]|uniref:DegT/DnrJ/EryC1/StrS family aminotransferase n=1 Tax=Nocardia vinacea TaxID=96468 RepID=A0ABZ1YP18_9NOCA|nr:DegT/DnrJ/EryC1/StrS family aminotransferase [Nocardia vinacea]